MRNGIPLLIKRGMRRVLPHAEFLCPALEESGLPQVYGYSLAKKFIKKQEFTIDYDAYQTT